MILHSQRDLEYYFKCLRARSTIQALTKPVATGCCDDGNEERTSWPGPGATSHEISAASAVTAEAGQILPPAIRSTGIQAHNAVQAEAPRSEGSSKAIVMWRVRLGVSSDEGDIKRMSSVEDVFVNSV